MICCTKSPLKLLTYDLLSLCYATDGFMCSFVNWIEMWSNILYEKETLQAAMSMISSNEANATSLLLGSRFLSLSLSVVFFPFVCFLSFFNSHENRNRIAFHSRFFDLDHRLIKFLSKHALASTVASSQTMCIFCFIRCCLCIIIMCVPLCLLILLSCVAVFILTNFNVLILSVLLCASNEKKNAYTKRIVCGGGSIVSVDTIDNAQTFAKTNSFRIFFFCKFITFLHAVDSLKIKFKND